MCMNFSEKTGSGQWGLTISENVRKKIKGGQQADFFHIVFRCTKSGWRIFSLPFKTWDEEEND